MKDRKLARGLDYLLGLGEAPSIAPGAAAATGDGTARDEQGALSSGGSGTVASQAMPETSGQSVRTEGSAEGRRRVIDVAVGDLSPNRNQPRRRFDQEALERLAQSIHSDGVVQPILARRSGDQFEIVAGERRWRAAKLAGSNTVPVVVIDADDSKAAEIALVENIQREDLNPIEKASGIKEMMLRFGYTQENAADRIGLDRSTVANLLRILDLPIDIQDDVSRGTLSMGHARALLAIKGDRQLRALAKRIASRGLSVRQVEAIASGKKRSGGEVRRAGRDPLVTEIETKLMQFFGTKVRLDARRKRGSITIDYYDNKQLDSILQKLGISVE